MLTNLYEKLTKNKALISILTVSLLLRILFSIDNQKSLFMDVASYEMYGNKILESGILSISAYHPPAYPLLIALVYKIFSQKIFYVYLAQAILGMFITLFIYLIARDSFSKKAGLISSAVSLLYWPLTLYSGILMSEILFIFLTLSGIYLFFKGLDTEKVIYFAACGISIALSSLTRSINLLLLFIIPLSYMFCIIKNRKYFFRNTIIFIISFCITIAPWALRNYFKFHKVILVDTLGGINLYVGNNDRARGLYIYMSDNDLKAAIKKYVLPQAQYNDIVISDTNLKKAAIKYIMQNKVHFVELTTWRLALFASFDFLGVDWILTTYMVKNILFKNMIWHIIVFISDILFFILAVAGLSSLLKNRKGRILFLFIIYYFCLTSLFYISARYRLPVIPFMSIGAAAPIIKIYNKIAGIRNKLLIKGP
jgi:4-amino-4-deoxy-L-arabinose transferase-like glycosyltransferase